LASLEGVANTGTLIDKLRRDDPSATAELHALHLLRFGPPVTAEMEPQIKGFSRLPDLRVGSPPDNWVYVEITSANQSKAGLRLRSVLESVANIVGNIKEPFTLEIFLRREPTGQEIETIRANAARFSGARVAAGELPLEGLPQETFFLLRHGEQGQSVEFAREELTGGLGLLIFTQGRPGEIMMCQHQGEECCPRLSTAKRVRGPTEPDRHLLVRMPFSDDRAEEFIRDEARQLPPDAPGLIMIGVTEAAGAFSEWEPLIRRRFQPSIRA
jgi:hypothetical protein